MSEKYREIFYGNYVKLQAGKLHTFSIEEYERFSRFYARKYTKFLPGEKNARIGDIGCGAGFFLYFIKKLGYTNFLGIDNSLKHAEFARSHGLNIKIEDMFKFLESHSDEFDFIFCSHVVEHLKKSEVIDFIKLIHASLKPGGKVIICTPNANALFGFAYYSGDFTHETAFTPLSLRGIMEACNFKVIGLYPEWPVAVDFQSTVRVLVWALLKPLITGLFLIQSGTDLWRSGNLLLENFFFAVGEKIS